MSKMRLQFPLRVIPFLLSACFLAEFAGGIVFAGAVSSSEQIAQSKEKQAFAQQALSLPIVSNRSKPGRTQTYEQMLKRVAVLKRERSKPAFFGDELKGIPGIVLYYARGLHELSKENEIVLTSKMKTLVDLVLDGGLKRIELLSNKEIEVLARFFMTGGDFDHLTNNLSMNITYITQVLYSARIHLQQVSQSA